MEGPYWLAKNLIKEPLILQVSLDIFCIFSRLCSSFISFNLKLGEVLSPSSFSNGSRSQDEGLQFENSEVQSRKVGNLGWRSPAQSKHSYLQWDQPPPPTFNIWIWWNMYSEIINSEISASPFHPPLSVFLSLLGFLLWYLHHLGPKNDQIVAP